MITIQGHGYKERDYSLFMRHSLPPGWEVCTLPSSAEYTTAIELKGPSPRLLYAPTLTSKGEKGGMVSFRKT